MSAHRHVESAAGPSPTGAAEQLRVAFDAGFAVAPADAEASREDFLLVRVAGDPYALRLREVAGLHRDAPIVRVARGTAELLGIATFRSMVTPIYDLASWLGLQSATAPRWLVLAAGDHPVGFAFDALDRHLRLSGREVGGAADPDRPFLSGTLRAAGGVRPLVRLPSIVDAVSKLAGPRGPTKER